MKKLLLLVLAVTSVSAFAQRYEIGRATKAIKIAQATTDATVRLNIPFYKIEERLVIEKVLCRIPTCSNEQGDGSEGNWHNFFGARQNDKAKALAAAIKGIGETTAEKIVDNNLFTNKPDSWREFSALIKKIEKQLAARNYNYKFATQVLEQYGYDNMISLGYGSERNCQYVETVCDQVSLKEVKTFSHYLERKLSVVVKNQTLQSFENDTVEITAGSAASDVSVSTTGFNNYAANLYERGSVLELDGTRILRAVPTEGTIVALTKNDAKNLVLNVTVPAKYATSSEDKGSSISATYDICRADWFGGCFDVVGGPWSSPLSGNKLTKTFTAGTLKKGSNYFVRVRLNKVDSKFYSESKSDRLQTNSVKN
jgi:hypothetical protein